jgi:hypothetical protein
MAQTRKRRRRKHRGTQAGRIDSGRRRGRPQNRAEAKSRAQAKKKRPARGENPPTWRGAIQRGVLMSVIFVVVLLVLKRPPLAAIGFGAFMLSFYIPMGFYLDRMMWRRRQRAKLKGG